MASSDGKTEPIDTTHSSSGVVASGPDLGSALPVRTVSAEDYEVVEELARGGMGRILRAWDRRHNRPVAIKVLLHAGDDAARRFAREALLTARLQHPAIIPLYEMGRWPTGEPFFAMKLVAGRSLAAAVADARTPNERLALLPHLLAATEALAYSHQQGIIHRDLKPSNVLVGPFGETVVIDWGLAKSTAVADDLGDPAAEIAIDRSDLTRAGAVVGTVGYMPPEQARGEPVDERADVFALGALAYHVLAGAPPHTERDPAVILRRLREGCIEPLASRAPDLPRDLVAIVDKAMAPRREDRYPTAKELAHELGVFAAGGLVAAYQYSVRELFRRWASRHRTLVRASTAFLAILTVVVATSVVVLLRANRRAEASADEARRRLVEAREEQGRRLVLAGDPRRGLLYLAEAYTGGARGAGLHYLLARATAALAAERLVVEHGDSIGWARFSPDGRALATASDDGTAALWDVAGGRKLATLRGHQGAVVQVEFSPDGARLVTASWDRTARIWDTGGALHATLVGHGDEVHTAVFSPDGSKVLTSSLDGTARLWDAATGEPRVTYRHAVRVNDAIFGAGGSRVVTIAHDAAVRIWEAESGRLLDTVGDRLHPMHLAADAHGQVLATTSGPTLDVWSITGEHMASFTHARRLGLPALSADGTRVAVGSDDGTTNVYDVAGRRPVYTLAGHGSPVERCAFSPDGTIIAAVSQDHGIELWDLDSGDDLARLVGHDDAVFSIGYDPTSRLLVTAGHDRTARVWDARASQRRLYVRTGQGRHGIDDIAVSADGQRLLVAGSDGTLHVRDASNGAVITTLLGVHGSARFSHDGRRVVYPLSGAPVAVVVELATGRRVLELHGHEGEDVNSAEYSPDDRLIVTTGEDATARVWNAREGTQLRVLSGHVNGVLYASFSPDGTQVTTSGKDGTARVWDVATGRQRVSVKGQNYMQSARFDPSGRRIITANSDKSARVWDARTGLLLHSFEDHEGYLAFADFDPTGGLAVTASEDGTARIWDVDTQRVVGILTHQDAVTSAVFAGAGVTLVTGSRDGGVRVWDTSIDTRSPAEVALFVRCRVALHLVDGDPVPGPQAPCPR